MPWVKLQCQFTDKQQDCFPSPKYANMHHPGKYTEGQAGCQLAIVPHTSYPGCTGCPKKASNRLDKSVFITSGTSRRIMEIST